MLFDPVLPDGTVVRRELPRSVVAFAAVAAGFVAARALGQVPLAGVFGVAAGACAVAMAGRGVVCKVALLVAAACLGAGWFGVMLLEPGSLSAALPAAGRCVITVEGVVVDTPRRVEPDPDPMAPPVQLGGVRAELSVRRFVGEDATVPVRGRLWLHAPEPRGGREARVGAGVRAGDRVRVTGLFTPIEPVMNPGEFDRRLWAAQAGYAGSLRVAALEAGGARAEGTLEEMEGLYLRCRAWLADRTRELLLGEEGDGEVVGERSARGVVGTGRRPVVRDGRALLAALILGDEDPALRETRSAFNRLGLAHILSISGFHIAVMTAVGLLLLRAPGDIGWLEPVLTAALIVVYLAILPFNAPVWRSGLMVLGLLAGDALGRRYDRLAILGWIATGLILWRPMDLWSIGFQLSFGLVALMVWLGTAFHQRLFGVRLKGSRRPAATVVSSAGEHLKRLVSTNILCCAAATPVIMYHTGLVSPMSVLSGVVLVPLITALLIAGYAAVLLGVLAPALSSPAAALITTLSSWTAWLVRWIDELPWTSLRAPGVSLAWAVAATAVVLSWLARAHRRDWPALGALAAVAAWLGAEVWFGVALPRDVALRVDTLAVGDGTCELVRSGRGALLWDCGSLTGGVGRMLVPRAVRALGAWRVPTVVVTHPNLDHFNGVLDVVEPLGVRTVLVGKAFTDHATQHPRSQEAYMLGELRRRGVEVRAISAGEKLGVGECRVEFLSPPADADWPKDNDMSLVAGVWAPGGKNPALMLCGDIQDQALGLLGGRGLHPAILEAPHHGSAREGAYVFVAEADPKVVLQSTGPSRAGDARWDAVRAGRVWLCTATDGACFAEVLRGGAVRAGRTVR